VQELKVSPAIRDNGVNQRLQTFAARRLAEEEIEKQKLLQYFHSEAQEGPGKEATE
jgi:hypothetical protein